VFKIQLACTTDRPAAPAHVDPTAADRSNWTNKTDDCKHRGVMRRGRCQVIAASSCLSLDRSSRLQQQQQQL